MEVMKEMNKQSEEAEKRFYAHEERRMQLEVNLEEQRRKQEEKHELRMQEMFMKMIQQMMPPPTYHLPLSHPYGAAPYTYDNSCGRYYVTGSRQGMLTMSYQILGPFV